jgi:hypothetical protein
MLSYAEPETIPRRRKKKIKFFPTIPTAMHRKGEPFVTRRAKEVKGEIRAEVRQGVCRKRHEEEF